MSNVLIGIIGVILFIGLALAGALFLGPRFQESTNNSRASAAVQAVSQVASAANMYRVQEGTAPTAVGAAGDASTATTLMGRGYLKSVPSNPSGTALPSLSATPGFVTMVLADNAEAVCAAINKQSGRGDALLTTASGTQGCTTTGTAGSEVRTAFASI